MRISNWFAAGTILISSIASAAPMISPNGTVYTSYTASSNFNASYTVDNLFDQPNPTVGQQMSTGSDAGIAWAGDTSGSGAGPHYVEFELDAVYFIDSIFYANRDFNNLGNSAVDKVTSISIWGSTSTPFSAANPGGAADGTVSVTDQTSSILREYTLPGTVAGRYFVMRFSGNVNPGVIGGVELRLGGVPEPASGITALAVAALALARRVRRA